MNQPSITWRPLDLPAHFKARLNMGVDVEIRIEGGPMPFSTEQEIYEGWFKTPFSDWESLGNGFLSVGEVKSAALIETSKKLHLLSENLKIQATWEQK
jgi:hypothetical protein